MGSPEVLGLFAPPTLEDCENAISRAILRIRSNGVKREELAKKLNCSASTIDSAIKEVSLLNFESVALLAYHYPKEFQLVEGLWTVRPDRKRTIADKLRELLRDIESGKP